MRRLISLLRSSSLVGLVSDARPIRSGHGCKGIGAHFVDFVTLMADWSEWRLKFAWGLGLNFVNDPAMVRDSGDCTKKERAALRKRNTLCKRTH